MASGLTPMDLYPVGLQYPLTVQIGGEVQGGLPTQVGQHGVGPLGGDDFGQHLDVEGFDVGHIRETGIGHDRSRVRIDQHDLVAQGSQSLAGLGSGIVEFTSLPDDDGAGTDDQNFMDVLASGHFSSWQIGWRSVVAGVGVISDKLFVAKLSRT